MLFSCSLFETEEMGHPYLPNPVPPLLFDFLLASRALKAVFERFGRVRYFFFFFRNREKKLTQSFSFKIKKQTVVAALDMPLPEDYIRRLAPPPRNNASIKCVVTGNAAKYRDPVTGAPYATVEAFKTLRAQALAAAAPKATTNVAPGEFFFFVFFTFTRNKNMTRSLCTEAPGFTLFRQNFPREIRFSFFRMADTQE